MKEYRFNVFGRIVSIVREHGRWTAFDVGAEGKRRLANFQIPDFVEEHKLAQYLGDLFHENATPKNSEVLPMSPPAAS
ncbi:hypothetical protein WN982_08995 [Paraburkholderia sp. IMGN_8]|uniref:DUF7661 family protein n=1 Tax=Paraburkholderia sp. IMGN_8 TaxID=3136564 RepID=UPI0031014F48